MRDGMRSALCVCLLVVMATSAQAVVVDHVTAHSSGWRGGVNISTSYCWLKNWPNNYSDGTIAEFDHTVIQSAIDSAVSSYGGWDAKVVVTQVNWITDPIPSDLDPVVVAADLDMQTVSWGSSTYNSAGAGSWMYGGSTYSNFVAAINAGAAAGDSAILTGAPWEGVWDTSLPIACYDIEVDVPESFIRAFLNNPSSDCFFVGAEKSDAETLVFYNDQWGQDADIRITIEQPPQTAPWLVLSTHELDTIVPLTSPTPTPTTVTVTNAGTGSLSWTASENPGVSWLSLSTPSGSDDDTFNIQIDVTGQSVGTYNTTVEVADPAANNPTQVIDVQVQVLATPDPIIELSPASIDVSVSSSASAPSPIAVTVDNVGLGTLSWTASESPNETWMSLSSTTGSDGDAFNVSIDHTGLALGTYNGTVSVTDPSATNSPVNLSVTLEVRDQDADITKANSYDDAWETGPSGWVENCIAINSNWSGTAGFVVHVGDSITYANPNGQWPRYGAGKTAEDVAICNWAHSSDWPGGGNDSPNGWYLAAWDMPGARSYTAESSITSGKYLDGLMDLPSMNEMYTPGYTNPDGKQYNDAVMAVIMLGTNDASTNRPASEVRANLEAIIDILLTQDIIPVISTIPPKRNDQTDVQEINAEIRSLAQTDAYPMIDFYEEVLRRRPGTSWDSTLISSDGVHPSTVFGGYDSNDDPYQNNGEPLSNAGYLLRSWLTVQKIGEVKEKVIDAGPPDETAPAAITDLATSNPQPYSIDLSWTAPGDDGSTGTASSYDVRYSTSSITEANWASASQASGEPSPASAGTGQNMTVSGLTPETTYYFAIKTSDEVPNTSDISNSPSATTTEATPTVWNVSTIGELENAMRNYNPGDEIVIAAGTYILDSYLDFDQGGVWIHGATGNRDDVVLQGPGINANVHPMHGIVVNSSDITVEDLTIRDVYYNGIQIKGENDVDRPTIRNLKIIDCGERYIKGSTNTSSATLIVDDILIEDVYMEQTQELTSPHSDTNYIGGIDMMGTNNVTMTCPPRTSPEGMLG